MSSWKTYVQLTQSGS